MTDSPMSPAQSPSLSPLAEAAAAQTAAVTDAMIELRGVAKAFGRKTVHRNIHLAIPPSRTTVIMGGSGEGKSVLLKMICGLLRPDRGTVIVDGDEITALRERELIPIRRKIGVVFQGAALFDSMTVRQNVGFCDDESGERDPQEIDEQVREKLRMVNLEEAYDKYPAELSGGMKKRVGIARAIMTNPKIILWDEPTTGLDPITAESLNRLIIKTREHLRATSVVITHDMDSAFKVADFIAMLFRGEIIWFGSRDETRSTDHPIVKQFINGELEGPMTREGVA